ncbi:MAG: response regulator transcription factor [Anaerolineae bacterium]|nr:response regulator transcription factor [Anaerolineae bacterium]
MIRVIGVRIWLADKEAKVRSALRLLLEQEPGVYVAGEAAEAQELLAQAQMARPDLILLDWELPGMPSGVLLRALRAVCPCVSVIVLSGRPEAEKAALLSGADAFVSKGDSPERLLAALRSTGLECSRN